MPVRLEDLVQGTHVRGLSGKDSTELVSVRHISSDTREVVYRRPDGSLGQAILYRDDEPRLEVEVKSTPWSFSADPYLMKLASEANRIRLAYLFDPHLAIHTSVVEPLPHQITAVYEEMLTRQPLKYLLADDPGAGKTIMTGLLIKELLARGDLQRCMIVCPGMLAEQWQDELDSRFGLPFEILTNDKLEAARTGNWFIENPLVVCRLDKLSRSEDVQEMLKATDWDLIVCDEAHKMSATFFGGEVKFTKRYRLGQLLSGITRHFLLLTATPHNGKEEDFQLFMALIDGDRFEGKFRDGVHQVDPTDIMRRLVKEQLLRFDGTRLFPERRAYTAEYELSDDEAVLYKAVTDYVREEFNRADKLDNDKRKGTVGFALTILQRRLASSPEAIYQSLVRRKKRLEDRLREEKVLHRGGALQLERDSDLREWNEDDIEEIEDAPAEEAEEVESNISDQATAARTIEELEAEINILADLIKLASKVRSSGTDRKWDELSGLLQDNPEMFDVQGSRRKLIIFTEHKDTLFYLENRLKTLLGQEQAVVTIRGGMGREERRKVQAAFTQDKDVQILVATDAAGEGINLQRAHLMVNYDLPWNPNRLEQRFGRIHRIGQTEVCHLWNLVANETREGEVFIRLLEKLDIARQALGGGVFDVLGRVFQGAELRRLLMDAVRYGDRPEVKARLYEKVESFLDQNALRDLLDNRALVKEGMDTSRVHRIREAMERADARRLQPYFIAAFFLEAFQHLGGVIQQRESNRFEITHVPAEIRSRDRQIGRGAPVLSKYERITFEKDLIAVEGKPLAEFVCPGHPLLDSTIDIILERYRELMREGAILVDRNNPNEEVRALFYLEHTIEDGRPTREGSFRPVSREMQFVEIDSEGNVRAAGPAPFLDYEPLNANEAELVKPLIEEKWLSADLESQALGFAIQHLVPEHFERVKNRKLELIQKTRAAVYERLVKEINHWDHRAAELKAQEDAGRKPRLNSHRARERAADLQARLEKRMRELDQEAELSRLPPRAAGGALIVPEGLIARLQGNRGAEPSTFARETKRVEMLAMQAVAEIEKQLGFEPADVSAQNLGYDIESRVPGTGKLRFLEVKGRISGARTVTVTKNEILTALNKPDDWFLALVEVPLAEDFKEGDAFQTAEAPAEYGSGTGCKVRYVTRPFTSEPDFGVVGVNYDLADLIARSTAPRETAMIEGSA